MKYIIKSSDEWYSTYAYDGCGDVTEVIVPTGLQQRVIDIVSCDAPVVVGGYYTLAQATHIEGKTLMVRVNRELATDSRPCLYLYGLKNCMVSASVTGNSDIGIGIALKSCENVVLRADVQDIGSSKTGGGYAISVSDCVGVTVMPDLIDNARYGVSFNGDCKDCNVIGPFAFLGPNVVASVDIHTGEHERLYLNDVRSFKAHNETHKPKLMSYHARHVDCIAESEADNGMLWEFHQEDRE